MSASIREFVLWHRGQRKRQRMQVVPQGNGVLGTGTYLCVKQSDQL